MQVNIHEAKTHLSEILVKVTNGEEVVIARSGNPIAMIIPFPKKITKRKAGTGKGEIVVHPSFNDPLPKAELDLFNK
jgi:prevent-host-death family protein